MKKLFAIVASIIGVLALLKSAFDAVAIYHVALFANAGVGAALFEASVGAIFSFLITAFILTVFCAVICGFIFAGMVIFGGKKPTTGQK